MDAVGFLEDDRVEMSAVSLMGEVEDFLRGRDDEFDKRTYSMVQVTFTPAADGSDVRCDIDYHRDGRIIDSWRFSILPEKE